MSWVVGFIGIGIGLAELIVLLILGGGAVGVVLFIVFLTRIGKERSTVLQENERLRDENQRLHDENRRLRGNM